MQAHKVNLNFTIIYFSVKNGKKSFPLLVPVFGPPLRPYTFQPVARKLETKSDAETKVGNVLNLRVNVVRAEDNIQACAWISPDGTVYNINKDTVTVNGKSTFLVHGMV